MKRFFIPLMSHLKLVSIILLFITSSGCGGREGQKSGDGSKKAVKSNISLRELQIKEADTMEEVAWTLGLQPVRPGVWLARDYHFIGKKEVLSPPIEVITDPSIVERVENGLRPDGEKMYSYPDKMPEGYPQKWVDYAIDIFPQKISESEGINSGRLVLYGHFVDPPYKIQVVIDTKLRHPYLAGRVLVNGIDVRLPTNKKAKEIEHQKYIASISSKKKKYFFPDAHQMAMQLLADSLKPAIGEDATIEYLANILKKDIYVKSIAIDNNLKTIQYVVLTDGILRYKQEHPDAYEAEKDLYGYLRLIFLRRKSTEPSLGQIVGANIGLAFDLQRNLARGYYELEFGGGGMSSSDDRHYRKLLRFCKAQKPWLPKIKEEVKKVLGLEELTKRLLANCGR